MNVLFGRHADTVVLQPGIQQRSPFREDGGAVHRAGPCSSMPMRRATRPATGSCRKLANAFSVHAPKLPDGEKPDTLAEDALAELVAHPATATTN